MNNKLSIITFEELAFNVGQETVVESVVETKNGVVFEDDGETGYFYAVDINNDVEILDALHIYNVANVIDKDKPSVIKILWTKDLTRAFLSINNYYHAVFDFKNNAGYCRNGFPNSRSQWTLITERLLTEELLIRLLEE